MGRGGSAPDARAGGSAVPCRQSPLTRSLPLAQPVPSVLMHEARHLSYLDPSSAASSSRQVQAAPPPRPPACQSDRESRRLTVRPPVQGGSLPVNSRQQLPLWLARSLHQRQHIQIDMPACYGTSYREAMRSDPAHMNLRDHSEYYFGVGVELSQLCARSAANPDRESGTRARCAARTTAAVPSLGVCTRRRAAGSATRSCSSSWASRSTGACRI